MLEINLKELIKSYDQNLLDNLRGFGREDEFLKFYVPGTNEYQSFLNLVDALVETEILSFKVIFEVADGKNSLTEEIKSFLSKISKFDIEKDKSFERVSIEININKYKNSQINRRNQSKEVIKQKIDNTKHVAIFGINENIKIEYKENLRLFNPKSFYKENFLEDENIFTEEIEDIKIYAHIEKNLIQNLYHNNNKKSDLQKLIDMFFEIILKKNVQEASDHGVIYLEEKIRTINDKIINNGIVLPGQAGRYFNQINDSIRNIYNNYKKKFNIEFGVNKNYFEISKNWKDLDYNSKLEKINLILNEICRNNNTLSSESITINKIENNFKVYLNIDKDFIQLQKEQNLLLKIEISLKKLDDTLEVFIDEILDKNKLRLKNSPQKIS